MTKADIITDWQAGNSKLDWRNLNNQGKQDWLKACLQWSGLPSTPILAKTYEIDGQQIGSNVDYYCLTGEVFFGFRGYFGQDIDGFYDCFSEIYMFNPEKKLVKNGATVLFKNRDLIDNVLGEDYLNELISIFVKRNFQVRFEPY
ncbi:MAG: barstar family protein [Bacteroidota bacterium]